MQALFLKNSLTLPQAIKIITQQSPISVCIRQNVCLVVGYINVHNNFQMLQKENDQDVTCTDRVGIEKGKNL